MSDINVGQFSEALNDKADRDLQNVTTDVDYVVESKFPTDSDPTWYRVYKSGWCEQGGYISKSAQTEGTETVNLLKSFANTNYNIDVIQKYPTVVNAYTITVVGNPTTSSFQCGVVSATWQYAYWKACGMIGE